jgi:hypothetical protein
MTKRPSARSEPGFLREPRDRAFRDETDER